MPDIREFLPDPGGLGAILGPPGCGKSLLLRAIASGCRDAGARAVGFDPFRGTLPPDAANGVRVLNPESSSHERLEACIDGTSGYLHVEGDGAGSGSASSPFDAAADIAARTRADVFFCDEIQCLSPFPTESIARLLSLGISFVFLAQTEEAARNVEAPHGAWDRAPIVLFSNPSDSPSDQRRRLSLGWSRREDLARRIEGFFVGREAPDPDDAWRRRGRFLFSRGGEPRDGVVEISGGADLEKRIDVRWL